MYPPRAIETYTNSLLENWNTVAIRGRQPRLVLDYSSSAPAFFFSATLDKLGVETVALNTFSRARSRFTLAESLPAATAKCGEMVRAVEADLGAILDPGAEYLYVVDEKGRSGVRPCPPASPVAAGSPRGRLRYRGPSAARDSSRRDRWSPLPALRSAALGTRRRHSWLEATRPNTVFAASVDGGYVYPSVLPSMDGLYALGKVLELVSTTDSPLSQLGGTHAGGARSSICESECPWELKGTVMRRMTDKLHEGRVSLVDGIKVFLDRSEWALMLPDAEEPQFHVYAEAGSDDLRAMELAESYRDILELVGAEGAHARSGCFWR